MCLLTVILTLLWTSGHCDVIHADSGGPNTNSGCTEPSWLCSELALMRRLITEQTRLSEQQSSVIAQLQSKITEQTRLSEQQSSVISQLQSKITGQTRLSEQQSSVIAQLQTKISTQDALTQHLHEELVMLKRQSPTPTAHNATVNSKPQDSPTKSEFRDVMTRADDLGPLEVVVNQMGQQLTAMTADIQTLKNTDQILQNANQQQDQNIQDARTSTFVHWGSSQCPSDAQLVYSGAVGGSHYTQSGGGTNYLCLTMSPVFGSHALPPYFAYLYGTEYETFNDAHHNLDAVCSVCRASHATTIMIPGTNVCTQGWIKQYDGYLMAEHITYNAAQFICVDSVMESRPGTNADLNGQLLHFTITQCGSLPCGPYENNKIVTCVVCSK